MNEAHALTVVIALGAAAFGYFYAVFPSRFGENRRRPLPPLRWYTAIDWYLKVTTIAVPIIALHWRPGWLLLLHDSREIRLIGLAIAGAGCVLLAWAMTTLAEQFSRCDAARAPDRLVEAGPYRWVRHPIYTANLSLLVGMAAVSGSAILIVNWLVLLACYSVIAKQEETHLAAELPEYTRFAVSRGRFFPRLW